MKLRQAALVDLYRGLPTRSILGSRRRLNQFQRASITRQVSLSTLES